MTPISYQGPLEEDDSDKHRHSQSIESNLGTGQPGLTVSAILSDKGDDVHTASPHMTVIEVVGELARLRIGALVVVDGGNVPVGIVSERDVVQKSDTKGLGIFDKPVTEIMTPNPQTCHPTDKIEDIMKRMTDGHFRHMPVIDGGQLCGVISIGDVVRHRMTEIEYENLKMKQAMVG